jgi:integrase
VHTRKGEAQRYRAVYDPRARRASANRTFAFLKAALNHAFAEQKVPSNAAWAGRRVPLFRSVDAARDRILTIEEARRLINACDPLLRDLVMAALATGARFGELTRLTVADFQSGSIFVRRSKSGRARHIFLTDEGETFFAQLFAGRAGNHAPFRCWNKTQQRKRFQAALDRAKITPPICFHGLRHTYASLSVMAGVPLMVVAECLGHADTRMVERHYGHLTKSFVRDAVRAGAPTFGTVTDSNVKALP